MAPEVSGDPNGDIAVWADANPEYQWLKDGVAITGATGSSYQVPVDAIAADQQLANYAVEIVYTDGEGFRNTDSPVTSTAAEVAKFDNGDAAFQLQVGGSTFSGAAEVGTEISAARISDDVDGNLLNGSSVGYEWQVAAAGTQDWSTVGTSNSYTPTTTDSGKDFQLLISYRDGQNYESLSALTASSPVREWTQLLGTSGGDQGRSISTAADGSIYITGHTYGDLDGQTNNGGSDAFINKYNSDGSKQWTQLLGTPDYAHANSISTADDGSIYITGYTTGDLDGQTNSGSHDVFISKFNSD